MSKKGIIIVCAIIGVCLFAFYILNKQTKECNQENICIQEGVQEQQYVVYFLKWEMKEHTSGKYVADLMSVGLDTKFPQRIGHGTGTLAWSNDGKYLAIGCPEPTKICIYDGTLLYDFSDYPPDAPPPYPDQLLKMVDVPDECSENISPYGLSSISWSGDGENLVIVCQDQKKSNVCVVNLDDSFSCWGEQQYPNLVTRADWSPTSQKIIIDTGDQVGRNPNSTGEDDLFIIIGNNLDVVDIEGKTINELTDGWAPEWSPDGTHIAFFRWDMEREYEGLGIMDGDGSNFEWIYRPPKRSSDPEAELTKLNFQGAIGSGIFGPSKISWTPDQRYLVVEVYLGGSDYGLYKIEIDTGNITPLTSNIFNTVQEPDVKP